MNNEPSFETDILIAGCLNAAQATGVPAPYLIGHALLFATAVAGGSACYRTRSDQVPQLIGTPATLLTRDDRCPYWFASATGGAIDLQEQITARAEMGLPLGITPAQVKVAKRMVKAHASIRHLMPPSLQNAMMHGLPSMTPASFQFLHDVRKGSVRKGTPLSAYGPHLIAYAEGEACYRDLLGKRLRPNSLYAAASNPSAEARVSIHGWAEFDSMKVLFRKQTMEVIPAFGFLMGVPKLSEQVFPVTDTSSLYLRFFNLVLQLRIDYPKVFLPDPEVIKMLDDEVRAQAERFRIGGVVEEVVNPRPMLPWNIATILWAIERNTRPEPEKIPALAKKACRIARFIHELHVHTLLRIFPTPDNGTTDAMGRLNRGQTVSGATEAPRAHEEDSPLGSGKSEDPARISGAGRCDRAGTGGGGRGSIRKMACEAFPDRRFRRYCRPLVGERQKACGSGRFLKSAHCIPGVAKKWHSPNGERHSRRIAKIRRAALPMLRTNSSA